MSSPQGKPPCVHTVQSGDTFSKLALAYYRDGSDAAAEKIAAANPGVSPTNLRVGQTLQIPALAASPTRLDDAYEARIVELVNIERSKAGRRSSRRLPVRRPTRGRVVGAHGVNAPACSPDLGTLIGGCSAHGAAENIAFASSSRHTPEQMMQQWMGSPGHRANILNPDYTHIGVAVARASNGHVYGTQNFLRL